MIRSRGCLDSRSLAGRPSASCNQRGPVRPPFFQRQYVVARPVKLRSVGGGDQEPQQVTVVTPPYVDEAAGAAAAGAAVPGVASVAPVPVYPEGTATYSAVPEAALRTPYAQAPPQYYAAPPPYPIHPMYMPPPPQPASSGLPWWILVGGGVLLGSMLGKLQELVKKGPQQLMAEMAMKQMMNSMGSPPGASPFGATPGTNPFAGFPPPPPPSSSSGAASSATVDATATQVPPSFKAPIDPSRPGDRFAQRFGGPVGSSTSSSGGGASSSSNGRGGSDTVPVVEATTMAEPTSSSRKDNGASSSSSRSAFFTDVNVDESKGKAPPGGGWPGAGQQASTASSTDADGTESMAALLEQMLRNPNMQKMLYPYLPENMRNPSSIEWMLSNAEVKKSMAAMFAQQNISPQMLSMMKNMDFNQDKVEQQFKELGMKPEDVMSKVMANPDLAAGFSNPKVQAAIMDISTNPMNIAKYAGDPEIMKVLNEVQALFQPDVPPQYR